MNGKKIPDWKNPAVAILSLFGVGFFPWAPGTLASLIVLIILVIVPTIVNSPYSIAGISILYFLSGFLSDRVQKIYEHHDPGWIVIDEVIGMWITSLFCSSPTWPWLTGAFVLFRFFDIVKVWPASWVDKKISHGFGVISDDVISALYAGLCLKAIEAFL